MSNYVNVKIPNEVIPKWFVVKNDWMNDKFITSHGEANWYVAITKEHPYYEVDYWTVDKELIDKADFAVHWWLTYGEHLSKAWPLIKEAYLKLEWTSADDDMWIFGFDTNHIHDRLDNWPMDKVIEHTQRLRRAFFSCIFEPRPLDKSIFDECWEKDE